MWVEYIYKHYIPSQPHTRMYICIYTIVSHTHKHTCIYIYSIHMIHTFLSFYTSILSCICASTCIYVTICIRICICVCECICIGIRYRCAGIYGDINIYISESMNIWRNAYMNIGTCIYMWMRKQDMKIWCHKMCIHIYQYMYIYIFIYVRLYMMVYVDMYIAIWHHPDTHDDDDDVPMINIMIITTIMITHTHIHTYQ